MAITGINNSSYTSYYASNYKNTVKKTDSEKDSTNTKDGNVTTSTVELKTSRPGVTKTEQIKTGYSNVNDYPKIIYVFLTIFLYLLKCPQSLILSALRAFCFCGKPHISRSIFLYFRYQAWLKSW